MASVADKIPNGGPVENVPLCLRERAQWVGWREELKPGASRPTKVPVDPKTGRLADTTDPATWGTFGEAFAGTVVQWDGIGYVFAADDPFCGIDLDDVIDPATGEIDPDAIATIDRFASYAEVSPSGAGVHIICRAAAPGGAGRKRGDRECYDRSRFFTVTGLRATPHDVEDRQGVLDVWHAETFAPRTEAQRSASGPVVPLSLTDAEIVAKIEASKQGEKFKRLWAGDTAGYSSGSEADLALCGILSFWCGRDPATVDRLFRASGLMRAKWDARRGELTYGQRTVARACMDGATYDPGYRSDGPTVGAIKTPPATDPKTGERVRRFKWMSELSAPPKADDWLWEGYLPTGGIVLLSALWKVGKTTLLSHLLRACETDGAFLGRPIRATKVLYVSEEGERHWVRRRDAMGLSDNTGMMAQPFVARPQKADWATLIKDIADAVRDHGFTLVIFDTLAKLWPVQEENDAGSVDEALMPLWEVTKAGAGVLLIHHLRKSGGAEYTGSRGSGALSAFPDIIVELTRFDPSDKKCAKRKLEAKGRYDETPEELVIELGPDGYRVVSDDEVRAQAADRRDAGAATEEARVVAALSDSPDPWMTTTQIRDALRGAGPGMRDADVATHLSSLMLRDLVQMRGTLRSRTNPRVWALASRLMPARATP